MNLVYAPEVIDDLVRLRAFIADHDPEAAAKVAVNLVARIKKLCAFPQMGRAVGLAPDPGTIRDFVFDNYVVRYSVHEAAIVVLRIWHHREDR